MKPNVVVCSKGKCPIISLFQSFDNHEERLTTLFLPAKLVTKINYAIGYSIFNLLII